MSTLPHQKLMFRPSYARTQEGYWLGRVERRISPSTGKPAKEYSVQIAYQKKRHRFPLATANKSGAARRALEIFVEISSNGWDCALRKFKPNNLKPEPGENPTVGDLIRIASAHSSARPESIEAYVKALRRLVAGVKSISDGNKFDANNGGNELWKKRVDAIQLGEIEPSALKAWLKAYEEGAESKVRARRTTNSLIRNAKSLFAKKILRQISEELVLPKPLMFEGISPKTEIVNRYRSKIELPKLFASATGELAGNEPEVFKAFVLTLGLGLRRKEADLLSWDLVDLEKGKVSVENTEYLTLKSVSSAGVLDLDESTLALFRGWRAGASGVFVIESPNRPGRKSRGYRCEAVWQRLIAWLRSQGIEDRCPVHALRKEIGSHIATEQGIFAASRYLRHSDVRITNAIYADVKGKLTPGLDALIISGDPKDVVKIGVGVPKLSGNMYAERRG